MGRWAPITPAHRHGGLRMSSRAGCLYGRDQRSAGPAGPYITESRVMITPRVRGGAALTAGVSWRCFSDGVWRDAPMPTYIDCHPLAAIPSAVQQQMHSEAIRGIVDEHGAQPLAHWVTDGVIYCVVQAPTQHAFCRHHAERGLPCDNVHAVEGLRGSHPLVAEETEVVRAVLTDLWPLGCWRPSVLPGTSAGRASAADPGLACRSRLNSDNAARGRRG
jgi:hypothetical protein